MKHGISNNMEMINPKIQSYLAQLNGIQ